MCSPLGIAGAALTGGSALANHHARSREVAARDTVLADERKRQQGFDKDARGVNRGALDLFRGWRGQQDARATRLGDFFARPVAEGGGVLPQTSSTLVGGEIDRQMAGAAARHAQQSDALGRMRAFGDLLGEVGTKQAHAALNLDQIAGFKRGSANVVPMELQQAQRAGENARLLADVLGGGGQVAAGASGYYGI